MRAVELAKVAASAEQLRIKRMVRRHGLQVAFWAAAGVFGVAVFVVLHVLIYNLLTPHMSSVLASLVLLAIDAVLAGVLVVVARRDRPDAVEEEARQIRQQALVEMRSTLTVTALAGSAAAVVLGRGRSKPGVTVVGRRSSVRVFGDLAARLLARR